MFRSTNVYRSRYRPYRRYNRKYKPSVKYSLTRNQKKEVKVLVDQKLKHDDESKQYVISGGGVTYAGPTGSTFYNLTAVPQDSTDSGRIGDEIRIKAIHIRLRLYNNTSNVSTDWRVMVFQYKCSDLSVAPVLNNLLLSSSANGSTQGTYSSRNIDYMGVYVVLYDMFFTTYAGSDAISKMLNINVPLKYAKKKLQYIAGSTNGTDNIYLLVTTASGTATNNPSILFDSNLTYIDP